MVKINIRNVVGAPEEVKIIVETLSGLPRRKISEKAIKKICWKVFRPPDFVNAPSNVTYQNGQLSNLQYKLFDGRR